jgi:hypothetical protein
MSSFERYIFKSATHTFQAVVDRAKHTISIGGRYNDCIELTFNISNNIAFIEHIQSEPECSLDSDLEQGESVDMIKASIQFVNTLYPSIKNFEFDDASKIDCETKTKSGRPPRRMKRPISLAHLSIATNKQTWYEKHFAATYKNEHEKYREKLKKLDEQIHIEFPEFIKMYGLTPEQVGLLEPKYMKAKSWYDLFSNIPKDDRCKIFYRWLEFCIQTLTDGAFSSSVWVIRIETMPKTEMTILKSGGKHKRYTRKNTYKPRFTNNYGHAIM